MRLLLLDRYVLREFVWPFLGFVAGFTVILVSGLLFELADLILVKQVPWQAVLRMLLYRLPSLIVISLPVGTLFGVILALGRLARDGELTVIRGAGVPFWRMAVWLLVAGVAVSGLTYLLGEHVVPWTNHEYEKIIRQVIFKDPTPAVQERVFQLIGITPEEAEERFGFLMRGLSYGAPPHGGIAFGLDRIVMLMTGAQSLRDVIPFPKTQSGADAMVEAPAPVDEAQLTVLGLRLLPPPAKG